MSHVSPGGAYVNPFAALAINAGCAPTGGAVDMSGASPKCVIWCIYGIDDSVVPFSFGRASWE